MLYRFVFYLEISIVFFPPSFRSYRELSSPMLLGIVLYLHIPRGFFFELLSSSIQVFPLFSPNSRLNHLSLI